MISKNDLFLLLTELEDSGEDVGNQISKLMKVPGISPDVLRFVNSRRALDVSSFYDVLRKSYNQKKSPLYKNLVKEEYKDPNEVLIILSALNLQIILFANKLEDDKMFLRHSRVEEVTKVLNDYYKTYDLMPCYKLLKLIKTDLIVFDYISGRRDSEGNLIKN